MSQISERLLVQAHLDAKAPAPLSDAEKADYKAADRAAQKGDYVRFGYEGPLDGKPLTEIVGDKGIYAKAPQTWEEVEGQHEGVLPGLAGQLAGVKAGDRKAVTLTFPAEFAAVPALARKLQTLIEVGLGYVRLGQSATTLSGGEAQRVKLSLELAPPSLDDHRSHLDRVMDAIEEALARMERFVERASA